MDVYYFRRISFDFNRAALCIISAFLILSLGEDLLAQPATKDVAHSAEEKQQNPTSEKTSEQVYKNIQALKGMPASKFMNTMFFMRYSLGVTCNYCHVGSQWEKDEKPTKARAREMIRMVMTINKQNFSENIKVNCYTCHRGTSTPATEISSPRQGVQTMIGPEPSFREKRTTAFPSPEDVLNRYYDALGGKDSLAKITSTVLTGDMVTSEGLIVPFQIYQASPNKWMDTRHFGEGLGDFTDALDGTIGWNKDNRGLNEKTGERLRQTQMDAEFNFPLKLKDLYTKLAVTGTEKMESELAYIVTGISTITRRTEQLFFGTESGYLLRRSIKTENIFGAIISDIYYDNYVKVNGVKLPIMVSEYTPDFGLIRKINTVDFNIPIDDKKFRKPEK